MEKFTEWHKNKKLKSKGTMKKNELDGLYTEWYENGQRKIECNFKNGKAYGDLKLWADDGRFLKLSAEKAEEYINNKHKIKD
jgi:antitoxin component YwqK of YwqJK toxin-antitoxin module